VQRGSRVASINGCAQEDRASIEAALAPEVVMEGDIVVLGLSPPRRLLRVIYSKRHTLDASVAMQVGCTGRQTASVLASSGVELTVSVSTPAVD
jgi:hypothetical protein